MYAEWLHEVKRMMTEGEEDGLAMALCQNMQVGCLRRDRRACSPCHSRARMRDLALPQESRRKDELLKRKDEELKVLRAERARARAAAATAVSVGATGDSLPSALRHGVARAASATAAVFGSGVATPVVAAGACSLVSSAGALCRAHEGGASASCRGHAASSRGYA